MLLRLLGFSILAFGLVIGSIATGQSEKAPAKSAKDSVPPRTGSRTSPAPVFGIGTLT